MAWERLSAGRYRNTETGEVRNSTTKPTGTPKQGGGKKGNGKKGGGKKGGGRQPPRDRGQNLPPDPDTGFPQQPPHTQNQIANDLNEAQRTDKAGDVWDAEMETANREAERDLAYNNPNQYNPFGSQTVTIDPVTGQPTVTQNLSPEQQQILAQQQGLSTRGGAKAGEQLDQFQRFNPEDFGADRARIEDEVFGRLTRGLDDQQKRDTEAAAQSLADRGIPYSNDPNSRYQQEMHDLNQRYDDARTNARRTATEMGGGELSRQFGIGQSTHQQQLSDIGALSGLGTGLIMPNFQPFQGTDYNPAGGFDIYTTTEQLENQRKQLAIEEKQANRNPGGGSRGGGGAPPPPDSDFERNLQVRNLNAGVPGSQSQNRSNSMFAPNDPRNRMPQGGGFAARPGMNSTAGLRPGQMNLTGGVAGPKPGSGNIGIFPGEMPQGGGVAGPGQGSSLRPDMSLPNTGYPGGMGQQMPQGSRSNPDEYQYTTEYEPAYQSAMDQLTQQLPSHQYNASSDMDRLRQQIPSGPPGQMPPGGMSGSYQGPAPQDNSQMEEQAFAQLSQQAGGPPGQPQGPIGGIANNGPSASMPGMQQQAFRRQPPPMTRVSPGVYRNERTGNLRQQAPGGMPARPPMGRTGPMRPMPPPPGLSRVPPPRRQGRR